MIRLSTVSPLATDTLIIPEKKLTRLFSIAPLSVDLAYRALFVGFGLTPFGTYYFGNVIYTGTINSAENPQTHMTGA